MYLECLVFEIEIFGIIRYMFVKEEVLDFIFVVCDLILRMDKMIFGGVKIFEY